MSTIKVSRIPILFLAMLTLIVGLLAGLARIGWIQISFPAMAHHGGMMVGGFLGTLIILEKIITLKKKWLYGFPIISGISVLLFLLGSVTTAFICLLIASTGLVFVFILYSLQERSVLYILMLIGSTSWLIGNIMLMRTGTYPVAISWWMGFILFIIASERLELMKFLPVSKRNKIIFISILGVFLLGTSVSFHHVGNLLAGMSLIGAAVWLLRFDLIGITLSKKGMTKYIAVSLLSGYISLLLTGLFLLKFSDNAFSYDIVIHTFFIGFAFAMIFAHGPIILPGIIGSTTKPFHPILYMWLALLHASWITRTIGGSLVDFELRKFSGLLTTAAIIGYFATIVICTRNNISRTPN